MRHTDPGFKFLWCCVNGTGISHLLSGFCWIQPLSSVSQLAPEWTFPHLCEENFPQFQRRRVGCGSRETQVPSSNISSRCRYRPCVGSRWRPVGPSTRGLPEVLLCPRLCWTKREWISTSVKRVFLIKTLPSFGASNRWDYWLAWFVYYFTQHFEYEAITKPFVRFFFKESLV